MCERPLRPHFAEPLRAAHPESRFGCDGVTNMRQVKFQLISSSNSVCNCLCMGISGFLPAEFPRQKSREY